jgi:hypothetical protein
MPLDASRSVTSLPTFYLDPESHSGRGRIPEMLPAAALSKRFCAVVRNIAMEDLAPAMLDDAETTQNSKAGGWDSEEIRCS